MKYTFFFRSYSPFSNWYKCEIKEFDKKFTCVEQYMMYHKALLFNDKEVANQIYSIGYNPKAYKELGRKVKGFNQTVWDKNKVQIVKMGCILKFTQNSNLKDILLKTKGTQLVEASPYDRIWGVGLSEDDERIHDSKNWKGLNLLGKILDEVREELI